MMNSYYADLHVHIGRSPSGRSIKITGSKNLTVDHILEEASERKGIDLIGIIDTHVPEILNYLEKRVVQGTVEELEEGGLRYKQMTLILGTEIEIYDRNCKGPIHVLCYMPNLEVMRTFSHWLSNYITNMTLSTQRFKGLATNLQLKVKQLGGLFIPAHVFTPFKSLYGSGVKQTLQEVFDPEMIDAIELGLSSNTQMADLLDELHSYVYLSNSDAHSLNKIGREYQRIRLKQPSFKELDLALHQRSGRYIEVNYGLDPRLGKYHRTCCANCFNIISNTKIKRCPHCGGQRVIKGVYERLLELSSKHLSMIAERPPYIHQVPLEYIPMLGPKTLDKLLNHFGTEMDIMHQVSKAHLESVVDHQIANHIILARNGKLPLLTGGAGRYGRVIK